MYPCMCNYIHTHISTDFEAYEGKSIHTRVCAHVHPDMDSYINTRTHAYTHPPVHPFTNLFFTKVQTYVHTYRHIYKHTHRYSYMYTHKHTYTHNSPIDARAYVQAEVDCYKPCVPIHLFTAGGAVCPLQITVC